MRDWVMRLIDFVAPSGSEEAVVQSLLDHVREAADEIWVDALGNGIARKRGEGPHLMLAAHVDEPGVMVIDIDDRGYLRVVSVGEVHARECVGQEVRFTNGAVGLVHADPAKQGDLDFDALVVDVGARSREDAERMAPIGTAGAVHVPAATWGESVVTGRALDNRLGCAVAAEVFRNLAARGLNVSVAFTAQNAVGARAAQAAAFQLEPRYALVIDGATADDVFNHQTVLSLGKGPVLKVMDRGTVVPLEGKRAVEKAADRLNLLLQYEVSREAWSDTGAIQLARAGCVAVALGYPVRRAGAFAMTADISDAERLVDLAVATVETLLG
ncbi:peptidase M42 [Alicyclobacillus acidocaldarius]|uniref:Peptidase M42 family protein n=1 Tax=Alicyclobacillus acidocaldarius subsp. acidocaldarius (strain ATCC 27009 / DSM 446 / BCRC 14685 / JCM 5260 / KCTC 1825 / NBRC 15652 / NCIMB 11725 / NRRL B-14509 / 104-IA) TaxID=521098 RepID=C8WX65_ALIAD|nr:peptidase M42 [Alicyclobacillus acidocaldarius]ACV58687.1 peptidase M42 family protein [Alicyclobacillus acidocaldarius subsp. acidocaldarius DSM 446]